MKTTGRILVGIVIVFLFFGGGASAENHESYESKAGLPAEALAEAGITPLSFFYFLDHLLERVQGVMISDTKKKLEFAFARLQERTAEIGAIRKEKGYGAYTSKEYEVAVGLQAEHIIEIGRHISKLQDEEVQRFYKKLRADSVNSQEYLRQDLLALSVQKKEMREAIAEARATGDAARTELLLGDLGKAKADYDRLAKLAELSSTVTDIAVERIEDLFEDSVKREAVLERAKKLESTLRAYDPEENAAVNSLAINRIREIIHKLRMEELEKEFKRVDAQLAQLLQDTKKQLEEFENKAKPPEEKERDRKQAEERAMRRRAQQHAEQSQTQEPLQPAPQQKQAPPPPLGQPRADTLGGPIAFTPLLNFHGTVGEKFEYSFCQPPTARTSDLCTAASTNPTGGRPPYHFQLGSGGFPPFGITLNLNGLMKGTPTAEGARTFSVCAVDLAGFSACHSVTFVVSPKEEEPPPYVPRQGCAPQSEVPQPPAGCSYEILRCNADTNWIWEYRFACPEPPSTNCWVEREECHKKNDNERVACYNSCPNEEGTARTQCSFDCTTKSNEQAERCNAIPCP